MIEGFGYELEHPSSLKCIYIYYTFILTIIKFFDLVPAQCTVNTCQQLMNLTYLKMVIVVALDMLLKFELRNDTSAKNGKSNERSLAKNVELFEMHDPLKMLFDGRKSFIKTLGLERKNNQKQPKM